jgi:replicative DNA helicase
MSKKYVDVPATLQVIGNIFNNPNILDAEDKYFFDGEDFVNEFHRILFGSIYNLYTLGASDITITNIEDYLSERPNKLAIYKANNGAEYLAKLRESASLASFDYYYNRLKKMSLLRAYDDFGIDLSWLYDIDNITDTKKKQAQEDWLDNTPLESIADIIDGEIQKIRDRCVNDLVMQSTPLGEGIFELLNNLYESPDIGYPLFGPYINTVTRGARLKRFYLRSAVTGLGKTRTMMADACSMAVEKIWDLKMKEWVSTGPAEPTLFISTEQDKQELQTMALAFVSGVNEDHILTNRYEFGEIERVEEAAKILGEAPIRVELLPDFSLKDIENTIKRNIRDYGVMYIFLDYIHTSMKILEEITRRSGGIKLREDNILFMISVKLKDICTQNGVFIMSATQLNMDYQHSKTPDQNLLRGAKAIADKIDVGMIMMDVTPEDLESLKEILKSGVFEVPDVKCSIYKNRGGPYKGVFLWMKTNRGICRYETAFVTKWNYELMEIADTKITVKE